MTSKEFENSLKARLKVLGGEVVSFNGNHICINKNRVTLIDSNRQNRVYEQIDGELHIYANKLSLIVLYQIYDASNTIANPFEYITHNCIIIDSNNNIINVKTKMYLSNPCSPFYEDSENWFLLTGDKVLYWDKLKNKKYSLDYSRDTHKGSDASPRLKRGFRKIKDGVLIVGNRYYNFNTQETAHISKYYDFGNAIIALPNTERFVFKNEFSVRFFINCEDGDLAIAKEQTKWFATKDLELRGYSRRDINKPLNKQIEVKCNCSKSIEIKNILGQVYKCIYSNEKL